MVWPCFCLHPEKNNWLFPPDTINRVRRKKSPISTAPLIHRKLKYFWNVFPYSVYHGANFWGFNFTSFNSFYPFKSLFRACLSFEPTSVYHLSRWLSWSKLNDTAACCSKKMWLLVCFRIRMSCSTIPLQLWLLVEQNSAQTL